MPFNKRIKVLDPQLANLIAAGEVVERPASVVKELIENSIDGGAKNIIVEIKNGGMTYIRVTDDGKGIPADEVETAFLRHATSKIEKESDLDNILTMGFRGEALAALAAVAKVDMFTRVTDCDEGKHICIEGGEITEASETGCPVGTNIVVRDLFYNVPARSKFMKKDSTESAKVEEAVINAAIAMPKIAFKFIKDGRESFSTLGNGSLRDVMYAVVGKEVVDDMIRVATEFSGIKIGGYIAGPNTTRATRSMQGFFINGRPVRSKVLTSAVDEAYKGRLMVGRQPIYYILLEMHPAQIDVNVHPSKLEVKFAREREVFLALRNAVSAVLDGLDMQKTRERYERIEKEKNEENAVLVGFGNFGINLDSKFISVNKDEPEDKVASKGYQEYRYIIDSEKNTVKPERTFVETKSVPTAGYLFSPIEPDYPIHQEVIADFDKKAVQQRDINENSITCENVDVRIIGELFHTYIIAENGKSMWLIDKHAVHERKIYNQLKESGIEGMAQYLFTPKMVVLSRNEKQAVLDNMPLLKEIGFDTEDFGGLSVVVRSAPNYIEEKDIPAVLSELAGKLIDNKDAKPDLFDALLKSVACKSAIKAGMTSDIKELKKLAEAVLSCHDLQSCPHGRPTTVELTKQQIEKMFKRIV